LCNLLLPWFIAYVYAFAEEKEATIEGIFNSTLQDDPRYQDLLRRMNLL